MPHNECRFYCVVGSVDQGSLGVEVTWINLFDKHYNLVWLEIDNIRHMNIFCGPAESSSNIHT